MLDEIMEWVGTAFGWLGEMLVGLVPSDWDTNAWAVFLLVWGGISAYVWFFGYYPTLSGGMERYSLFMRFGTIIGVAIIVMFFINQQRSG